jgi:hypothetical protein
MQWDFNRVNFWLSSVLYDAPAVNATAADRNFARAAINFLSSCNWNNNARTIVLSAYESYKIMVVAKARYPDRKAIKMLEAVA